LGKIINQITFNFAEEGPGRGSENVKKGCNVSCFDFFLPFSLFIGCRGCKNDNQHKLLAPDFFFKFQHTLYIKCE